MIRRWRRLALAPGLLLVACMSREPSAPTEPQSLPREVEAVRKYLLEVEYPELFGDEPYRTRIEDALVTDLDGDGSAEVVVLFSPHYRQSAPIVIYHVSQDLKVTRVTEGLAPGPLQPLSGDYLDSHALGEAVDFSSDAGPAQHEKLLQVVLTSRFGGVVEYASFMHADNRKGRISYLDMTAVEVPDGDKSCEHFEFSKVDDIAAGALDGDPSTIYLAAHVGRDLWIYRITGFLADGRLRKEVRVLPVPNDFARFAPAGPVIRYLTATGESRGIRPAP